MYQVHFMCYFMYTVHTRHLCVKLTSGTKMFTFIELHGFSKRRKTLLPDEEFREFQELLIEDPETGDVIIGTGGFRKIRWSRPGMGKRGGVRIIYYAITHRGRIYLALIYAKNEQDDLTEDQKKALKHLSDMLV